MCTYYSMLGNHVEYGNNYLIGYLERYGYFVHYWSQGAAVEIHWSAGNQEMVVLVFASAVFG